MYRYNIRKSHIRKAKPGRVNVMFWQEGGLTVEGTVQWWVSEPRALPAGPRIEAGGWSCAKLSS